MSSSIRGLSFQQLKKPKLNKFNVHVCNLLVKSLVTWTMIVKWSHILINNTVCTIILQEPITTLFNSRPNTTRHNNIRDATYKK